MDNLYGIYIDGTCCHTYEAGSSAEAFKQFLEDHGYESRREAMEECCTDDMCVRKIRRDFE